MNGDAGLTAGRIVDRRRGGDKRALAWLLLAATSYGAMALFVRGAQQFELWLLLYLLATAAYLALWSRPMPLGWPLLIAASLSCRLLLVATPIWLSDDLYRYLLDGKALASGLHPFRYEPSHPIVQALAPELAARVNHPDVPTIYPPSAQLLFYAAARLDLGVVAWRLLLSLFDVLALPCIALIFGSGARGRRAALVYGLCPLAIVESGANGHLEGFLTLTLCSAWCLWLQRRSLGAGLALATAILCKFTPLFVLPLMLRLPRARRVLCVALPLAALGLLLFHRPDVDLFAGLRSYLGHWSFNGPIYALARQLGLPDLAARSLPFLWLLLATVCFRRGGELTDRIAWWYFGFLLCAPTIHPWYALWLLPWLGPRPHWGLWAFVIAMGLSYAVHWQVERGGAWELPLPVAIGLWGIVALAFGAQFTARFGEPALDNAARPR